MLKCVNLKIHSTDMGLYLNFSNTRPKRRKLCSKEVLSLQLLVRKISRGILHTTEARLQEMPLKTGRAGEALQVCKCVSD